MISDKKIQTFRDMARSWVADYRNVEQYPKKLIEELGLLGILGANISREFGGLELSKKEVLIMVRELAKEFVPITGLLGSHMKVSHYIAQFGTPAQKKKLLPQMAKGSFIAAHAYTEKSGKSISTFETRVFVANGKIFVKGHKAFVTNAATADLIAIVAAREKTGEQKEKAVVILLPSSHRGLSVGSDMPRLGMDGISLCPIEFECEITADHILGGNDFDAKDALEKVQVETLLNYIARAIGLAETILEETIGYVGAKKSGATLLKDIPAVQDKITDMKSMFNANKKIFEKLLSKLETKIKTRDESIKDVYWGKGTVTESVVDIARMGLALHGGAGYTRQYAIERHLREAIGLTLIGTPTDIALEKGK